MFCYRIDHGPFDVVTVRQVVNKPRGVNKTALDFRHEHLYGDRLKRVDSKLCSLTTLFTV